MTSGKLKMILIILYDRAIAINRFKTVIRRYVYLFFPLTFLCKSTEELFFKVIYENINYLKYIIDLKFKSLNFFLVKWFYVFDELCMCAQLLQSFLTLCDPMNSIAHQAPLSIGFSRQEYWSEFLTQGLNSQLLNCGWILYR